MSTTIRIGYGKNETLIYFYFKACLYWYVFFFLSLFICVYVVPEHFSTPLYIARDLNYFKETGVNVELVLCPGKNRSYSILVSI